jgi:hypothetical protein
MTTGEAIPEPEKPIIAIYRMSGRFYKSQIITNRYTMGCIDE